MKPEAKEKIYMTSLDLEMNQPSGKIISIGLCRGNIYTGEVVDQKEIFVRIDEPLQRNEQEDPNLTDIVKLTGITEEKLAMEGISLKEAYKQVVEFHSKSHFINPIAWGHGDSKALLEQVTEVGVRLSLGFGDNENPIFCFGRRTFDCKQTYQERMIKRREPIKNGLKAAMTRYGLPFTGRAHGAMVDAINTFKFYSYLLNNKGAPMLFKKYNSIENIQRSKTINIMQLEHNDIDYYVQEKIHGANFAFYTDGSEVKCAKRSGFVGEDEDFFNYERVLDRFEKNIDALFTFLHERQGAEELVVCGELYGGTYPHKDVEAVDTRTVQKGVYYSPDLEFACFDIKVDGQFVGMHELIELCKLANIPLIPIIRVGSLKDCLEFKNAFPSIVPEVLHNLPLIEGNICEGTVIKPVLPRYFGNGSRVMVKNKNERFAEISGSTKSKRYAKPPKVIPEHVQSLISEASRYVTENRLRNVLSKEGEFDTKLFGKFLGLFSKDIIEDFRKDFDAFDELSNEDRKPLTGAINKMAGNLIRDNLHDIKDGNF